MSIFHALQFQCNSTNYFRKFLYVYIHVQSCVVYACILYMYMRFINFNDRNIHGRRDSVADPFCVNVHGIHVYACDLALLAFSP